MPEMMVVIIIVVLLMGMGIPAIVKLQKRNAVHSVPNILLAVHNACRENARQFGASGVVYGWVLRYYAPGSGPLELGHESPDLGTTPGSDPVPGQPVWSATQIVPWVRVPGMLAASNREYDFQYYTQHGDGLNGQSDAAGSIGKQVPWSAIPKPVSPPHPAAESVPNSFFVGHAIDFKASGDLLPADGVFFNDSRFISRSTATFGHYGASDEYRPPLGSVVAPGVPKAAEVVGTNPTWRLYVAYQPRTGRVFAARQELCVDHDAGDEWGRPHKAGNPCVQNLVDTDGVGLAVPFGGPGSIASVAEPGTKLVIPLWGRVSKRREQFFVIYPNGDSEVTGVYP